MSKWRQNEARILVVDDNEQNTTLLHGILEQAGYSKVYLECDSRKVIGRIRSLRPDLVILDLHMPGISGLDILAQLRDDKDFDVFTPVLACTADWTEPTRKSALDLGAWDFITKPFNTTEMLLRIRNFLRMREMHLQLENRNAAIADVWASEGHVLTPLGHVLRPLSARSSGRAPKIHYGRTAKRGPPLSARLLVSLKLIGRLRSSSRLRRRADDLGNSGANRITFCSRPGSERTMTRYDERTRDGRSDDDPATRSRHSCGRARNAEYYYENWDGRRLTAGHRSKLIPVPAYGSCGCRYIRCGD